LWVQQPFLLRRCLINAQIGPWVVAHAKSAYIKSYWSANQPSQNQDAVFL